MNKKLRKILRIAPVVLVLALLAYLLPIWVLLVPILAYALFGFLDVKRNDLDSEAPVLKRYFAGNGLLTWLLSPFNLLMDLLSKRTKGVPELTDLPEDCQAEINQLIAYVTREKQSLIERIESKMATSERVMLLLTWYGRQIDPSVSDLTRDFKYIKTIGVSVFAPNTGTKFHYGPLRITYRLLYNLTPIESDDVFIQVGNRTHYWHENPMFIFDDTLMHRSVNGSDQLRYCLFVDFMRPSAFLGLTSRILNDLGILLKAFNRLFYKNWDFVR